MTKLYRVTSPQEIIDHFERMAKEAEVRSVGAGIGVQERALSKRECVTWRAAADTLRNTDFAGWLHNGVTIDEIKNSNTPEARAAWDRLQEIANRDEAKSVTVRADDLRLLLRDPDAPPITKSDYDWKD